MSPEQKEPTQIALRYLTVHILKKKNLQHKLHVSSFMMEDNIILLIFIWSFYEVCEIYRQSKYITFSKVKINMEKMGIFLDSMWSVALG